MNKAFQYPICDKCLVDKCELGMPLWSIDRCMCQVNGGICPLFKAHASPYAEGGNKAIKWVKCEQ